MRSRRTAVAWTTAFPFALTFVASAHGQEAEPAASPNRQLGVVTITSGQPTSLPTQIPATVESSTREQIEQTINATDSEDALKYFPSLLVRKRYIGDYNHAILSSRASGTGNSARSAVYADGILLSNFLGNGVGGLSFPPRWGMVTPEEIDRVDVMYGPFSAAYPGNSVGAVVDYVTRMPQKFEAHAKAGYVRQPFEIYGHRETFNSWQASASAGSRAGDWSWWLNFSRTDSQGQPLTFATRLVSSGVPGPAGTPVTGAVPDRNTANAPIYVIGAGTQYRTEQDHIKAKVAYDVTPTLKASYALGWWHNESRNDPTSYLRNGAGNPVYGGAINIGGAAFPAVTGGDFAVTREQLTHFMHALSLKSNTRGTWDWEVALSQYDYARDKKRQNGAGNTLPAAADGGPGTVADGSGTGWINLALRGTWRPQGPQGPHVVDFGWQQDRYELQYKTSAIAGNYLADGPGSLVSDVGGKTALKSLWLQDVWSFAPGWKAVLGGRQEWWRAYSGFTRIPGAAPPVDTDWPDRHETHFSPKAALSWQWRPDTAIKGALGRAVRFPTVGELYGATSTTNARYINDPNLKPERSWTGELTLQKDLGNALLRLTAFAEDTRDGLYSQTVFDPVAGVNVTRVQNVGRVVTKGVEAVYNGSDVWFKGLDLSGSVTWADSEIRKNDGFVATPGDTIGKRQPNIPRWRATALVAWRFTPEWSASVGARYSGRQYRTLNNSDVNGYTYMGVSKFFVVDLRARWQIDRQWSAAFGIDNANNDKYWNFHPYPQRSYVAEIRADL